MVLNNKECVDFEALIDDFLSDELSVDTNRRMLTHLKKCSGCRSEKSAREELREAMKQAWRSVRPPDHVMEQVRRTTEASGRRRTGWTRFAAVAASLLIAVASYLLLTVGEEDGEVVDHFRIVAKDHIHCAGQPAEETALPLEGAWEEVGLRLLDHPAGYRLAAVRSCRLEGKTFSHYIFRGDSGLLSLMLEKRSPTQTLASKDYGFVSNGIEFSTSREGPLTVTAIAVSQHFVYLVGDNLDLDQTQRIAREIVTPLAEALAG